MNKLSAVIVLSALPVAAFATGLVRQYALRSRMLDVPNVRSSHAIPTPRGGGAAIVLTFFATLMILYSMGQLDGQLAILIVSSGGTVAAIGFIDDRRPVDARIRLLVHIAAAIVVVALFSSRLNSRFVEIGVAALAIVWMTNLFNFMDGIDGIAASEGIFVAAAGAWINVTARGDPNLTLVMFSLAMACGGFLLWNWPRARIFMGDVGSGFLGFTLALLGFLASQRGGPPIEAWGILTGVFLVDATLTLTRRMARGDRWFEAHRIHAYQHLARRLGSHLPVTVGVNVINLTWLLPWTLYATSHPQHALLAITCALAPLFVLGLSLGSGRTE